MAQARAGRRAARPAAGRTLGRPAAARGAGPRASQGAGAAAARRAALEPRRLPAPDHAQRNPPPAAQARRTHDPRDARPDRGHDDGRPRHLHEQGPDRADRHRGRSLPPARQPVRRELHRLAADQPAAGRQAARRLAVGEGRCRADGKASGAVVVGIRPERVRLGEGDLAGRRGPRAARPRDDLPSEDGIRAAARPRGRRGRALPRRATACPSTSVEPPVRRRERAAHRRCKVA